MEGEVLQEFSQPSRDENAHVPDAERTVGSWTTRVEGKPGEPEVTGKEPQDQTQRRQNKSSF